MVINIKLISNEVIKPSHPTPAHLLKLQSSLFYDDADQVLMPLIFFYSKKNAPSNSEVLYQLKRSLPATLSVFYPLAGRIQSNYIGCNDEGVPYVQAQVRSSCLADVVHKADVSELDKLLPSHGSKEGYTKLLLVIQVSSFACGGVAIGIKMSHAISEAFSMAMFVKTWAAFARDEDHSKLLPRRPYFDIWKVFPTHPSAVRSNTEIPTEPNPDLIRKRPVTKWLLFSKADCVALRSRLGTDEIDNTTASLTLVLSAFISNRIKIACRSNGVDDIIRHVVFHAVNIRPKVNTTLIDEKSCYLFGSMVVNAVATPNKHNFVTVMKESIEKITGNSGVLVDDLQEGRKDLSFMMEYFKRESRGEIALLGFSSLRSLPVYEADFGWGKPVWVTVATLVYGNLVILIPAGPSSEDTVAYVNLAVDERAKLEADLEFMSFVSKSAATFASNSKL